MSTTEEPFPLGAIPERLKCSLCTALARDAWKLPCCDQIVCGACFETLPIDACPICAFSPFDKANCVVSTSLRTTIAVFLRHAEKRHNDALAKEAKEKGTTAQSQVGNLLGQTSEDITVQPIQKLGNVVVAGNEPTESLISDSRNFGQAHALDNIKNPQEPSNFADVSQQLGIANNTYDPSNMYASGMPGMNMGFPMMSHFGMASMNPMMMPQITANVEFGGYGYVGNWDSEAKHNHTQQNMYMQTQDHDFPEHAPAGPSSSEYPRGGYRGRYISRGNASFRGGRGVHPAIASTAGPVVVEGAPTGPSAMRNGYDSRNRGSRGRGGSYQNTTSAYGKNGSEATHEQSQTNIVPEAARGRSMTRSITRERSFSPRNRRRHSKSPDRAPTSPGKRRSRSRSNSHFREQSYRERKHRSTRENSIPKSNDTEPITEDSEARLPEKSIRIKGRSLADRIDRRSPSRQRSRSPVENRSKTQRSSHRRRRRHRSKSRGGRPRSRSHSRDRQRRSRRDDASDRDVEESKKHKKNHSVLTKGEDENQSSSHGRTSKRRRSRDRRSRKSSRRSSAKYEVGSPELRRIESEREHSRYD